MFGTRVGGNFFDTGGTAPFIFDKGISDFLEEVSTRGSKMRARVGDKPIYEVQEHVGKYNDNFMWLSNNFDKHEGKFQSSMNLSRLSPFPINYALPTANPASPNLGKSRTSVVTQDLP